MSRPCPKCGSEEFTPGPGPGKDEFRKAVCLRCTAVWWQPKDENEKTKRPAAHRSLARKFGQGFCEFCGRLEAQLPKGETLTGHHIEEYQHDGEATAENTLVLCTMCHAYSHHLRTYLGHYHSGPDGQA